MTNRCVLFGDKRISVIAQTDNRVPCHYGMTLRSFGRRIGEALRARRSIRQYRVLATACESV